MRDVALRKSAQAQERKKTWVITAYAVISIDRAIAQPSGVTDSRASFANVGRRWLSGAIGLMTMNYLPSTRCAGAAPLGWVAREGGLGINNAKC